MTGRKLLTGVVVLGLVFAACGGSDTVSTTEVPTATEAAIVTTTTPPSTTTTEPLIDVFREVRSYLVDSMKTAVVEFVDQQLAEAGESAAYTVLVDLDGDPVVELSVASQASADALNEVVGTVNLFDSYVVFHLFGGGGILPANVPILSGDETFASLQLPVGFINAGFLDGLGELMIQMGLPSSTVARMENTRALDGTLTTEGDGIVASWTYHPDDGLSIILERQ